MTNATTDWRVCRSCRQKFWRPFDRDRPTIQVGHVALRYENLRYSTCLMCLMERSAQTQVPLDVKWLEDLAPGLAPDPSLPRA